MQIKFICLNLWLGGKRFDSILKFLAQEQPDILALQEAYDGHDSSWERRFRSIGIISGICMFPYHFFSPACVAIVNDHVRVEAGNAIFSLFPIIESDATFFDVPFGEVNNYETSGGDFSQTPRNLQRAMIPVGNTHVNVFNTQGIWGKDVLDNDRRLAMCQTITDAVRGKQHTILAGDFNVISESKSIAIIENQLTNVFKGTIDGTFNPKQAKKKFTTNTTVDMVFASSDLKLLDFYRPDVDVSDHFPLVCVFEF